jgi:hypothetical protein
MNRVLALIVALAVPFGPSALSQTSKDIFADTFITGLTDSTVLFPWGNQICDTSERIVNTHGIGKTYNTRIKILPNTARNGSTALWVRSRDGAWIVIQSNNVDGGRTCIAAKGDAGTKLPNITIGRPRTDEPSDPAPAVPVQGDGAGVRDKDAGERRLTAAEATCKPGSARMPEIRAQGFTKRVWVRDSKRYPSGMEALFENPSNGDWYILEGDFESMCITAAGKRIK